MHIGHLANSRDERTFSLRLCCATCYTSLILALSLGLFRKIYLYIHLFTNYNILHIQYIYTTFPLLSFYQASAHFRAIAFTETPLPIRGERRRKESTFARRASANAEDCFASSTILDLLQFFFSYLPFRILQD